MKTYMRKFLAGLLALGLVLAPSVGFAQYRYWWQVVDEQGRPYLGQTVRCSVYTVATGAPLHFTVTTGVGSSQPLLSDVNSAFHFTSAASSDVQIVCNTLSGGQANTRLRWTDHTIVIDRQGRKIVRFQFVQNATATNTNVFIPAGAVIRDVLIQLSAGAVNSHLEVGFRGDHFSNHSFGALVHRMSLQTGDAWLRPHAVIVMGEGSVRPRVAEVHRGVALAISHTVTAAQNFGATNVQNSGFYVEIPYVVGGPNVLGGIPGAATGLGVELQYRTSNTAGISGHVYVMFDSYHTGSWFDYRY